MSTWLYTHVLEGISVQMPICLNVCPSVHRSVCMKVYLCLSKCPYAHLYVCPNDHPLEHVCLYVCSSVNYVLYHTFVRMLIFLECSSVQMSITLMSLSILTSIFLDTCLSDHPSVGTCLSEHLFICLNVQLCECLFICLNVCLNICLCEWFPFEKSICINICPFVWILMGLRAHVLESVWHTPIYQNTSICLNVFWMSICLKVCLCECLNNHLHEPLSVQTSIWTCLSVLTSVHASAHLSVRTTVCLNICPSV